MSSPQVPLADDLYLAAHDSVHGRCVLSRTTLGLGLGSAVLGELVLRHRLEIRGDRLAVLDNRPTDDPAGAVVLDQITRDAGRGVRDWIAFLARGAAPDLVARRLTRAGLFRRVARRGLLGTRLSYVPIDSVVTGRPGARVRIAAERREPLPVPDLMLTGLIFATGLDQHALLSVDPHGRAHLLDQLRRRLPANLQRLLGHAEAAVGEAVMARRA